MRQAKLILDDGSQFSGHSFGYESNTTGEVVFNTAMMGYPESLTDPSYAGQMMTLTYPPLVRILLTGKSLRSGLRPFLTPSAIPCIIGHIWN